MRAFEFTSTDRLAIVDFINRARGAVQQHPAWGAVQQTLGVGVRYFGVRDDDGALIAMVQVIIRHLPLGLVWWSAVRGPVISRDEGRGTRGDVFAMLIAYLRDVAAREHVVFMRFDGAERADIQNVNDRYALRPSHHTNFPDTTLVIDLAQSEEDIIAAMHPKGRYNIRVAEKHGVTVRETTDVTAADMFYDLLKKTTARDGFAGHSCVYYRALLSILAVDGLASCFLAEKNGQLIAASLVTWVGDTATYYYGASDHAHRASMAPYAVQWAAIRAARERGFQMYDFLGIAPPLDELGVTFSKDHHLAGVTDFKRKFGGRVVSYAPSHELVLRPFVYCAINVLRRLRR